MIKELVMIQKKVNIERIVTAILFVAMLLFFVTELVVTPWPQVGKLGVALWIILFVFLFASALHALFRLLKEGYILTIITIIVIITALLFYATHGGNISGDTTQQAACTLNMLKTAVDSGLRQTCHLGYPLGQYFILIFPTLLFGKSLGLLNIGASLYFFVGIVLFAYGISQTIHGKKIADLVSATMLALFFHSYFVNEFLLYFEQATYPFSLTLSFVGLYLLYRKKKRLIYLLFCGVIAYHLLFSYTPSLAVYAMVFFGGIYHIFKKNISHRDKFIIIILLITTGISFYLSTLFRLDIRLVQDAPLSLHDIVSKISSSFLHLLFQSKGSQFYSPYLNVFFMLSIILLVIQANFPSWAILLWIAGVVALSSVAKGYAEVPIDFALHRAIVIFPVLAGYIIANFDSKIEQFVTGQKKIAYSLCLFIIGTGILYNALYVLNKNKFELPFRIHITDARHATFIEWFNKRVEISKLPDTTQFVFDTQAQIVGVALADKLQYFNSAFQYSQNDSICDAVSFPKPTYIVSSQKLLCTSLKLKYIGIFQFYTDKPLFIYEYESNSL